MAFPQMFDDPYGSAYGVNPQTSGASSSVSRLKTRTASTTSGGTPAGKTWFSDILNKKLPSTSRPHMTDTISGGYGTSSGSSGSASLNIPYGSKTSWEPGAGTTKPTMGAMTPFAAPTIDRGRISELTELSMGAPMGKLRRGLSEASLGARSIENPNVRANQMRSLMAGYGEGISDIRAGSSREAMSLYMPEFQGQQAKAAAEFGAGVSRTQMQFQADIGEYMKSGSQVTTPVQGRFEGSTLKPISWDVPDKPEKSPWDIKRAELLKEYTLS